MNVVFVVTNSNSYLDWDDRGAMSTGYPLWVDLAHARKYHSFEAAQKAGESIARLDKHRVWVETVTLIASDRTEVLLPESDPEWPEYQRLKTKFKNK